MRRLPGQAARVTGKLLHRACTLLLLVALGGTLAVAALAWRLSQGPLELPWLAQRMQAAANADSGTLRVAIGGAALTWEGFARGVDRPLDIRLRDVRATDPSKGHSVTVPQIDVSLALGGLLMGRIQPRALEIESARLVLLRTEEGNVRLDFAGSNTAVDKAGADKAERKRLLARAPRTSRSPKPGRRPWGLWSPNWRVRRPRSVVWNAWAATASCAGYGSAIPPSPWSTASWRCCGGRRRRTSICGARRRAGWRDRPASTWPWAR